jgi:integrase
MTCEEPALLKGKSIMRKPEPFFRKQTQSWYVEIKGVQHPLGKDRDKAFTKYHTMMAGRLEPSSDATAAAIIALFLAWNQEHRDASTHRFYSTPLVSFAEHIGVKLKVADLKPYHVEAWADTRFKGKSSNYRRSGIRAVQRAFNWAVELGHIEKSPVKGVKKPAEKPRDQIILPEQWAKLVELLENRGPEGVAFLDVITLMRFTGCRPKEARTVQARHLDRTSRCIVFERELSKGESSEKTVERRVVPLTDVAFALCSRLALKYPEGPLFRTSKGTVWSHWDFKDWFGRLAATRRKKNRKSDRIKKVKPVLGFKLCAYAIRHTFATEALERGVDPVTVATLMGHKDLTQLMKTYQHLSKKSEHLRRMLAVAVGESSALPAPELRQA